MPYIRHVDMQRDPQRRIIARQRSTRDRSVIIRQWQRERQAPQVEEGDIPQQIRRQTPQGQLAILRQLIRIHERSAECKHVQSPEASQASE